MTTVLRKEDRDIPPTYPPSPIKKHSDPDQTVKGMRVKVFRSEARKSFAKPLDWLKRSDPGGIQIKRGGWINRPSRK